MFVDTHCHIHDRETYRFALDHQQISRKVLARDSSIPCQASDFSAERILERAREAGVSRMITIGTSSSDSLKAQEFAEAYPEVFWTYGIHPDEAGKDTVSEFSGKPIAIGEVGLDYRNGMGEREAQIRLFEEMIELALSNDLPLVFHVRDAFDDFWPIVDNAGVSRAVVHSFSDSPENLEKALSHDFYVGVNGLATFADLPTPPLEKTLLETDAPFLAPVPVRGRVNEPSYVPFVAKFLAEKHGASVSEVAEVTTRNAETLFRI